MVRLPAQTRWSSTSRSSCVYRTLLQNEQYGRVLDLDLSLCPDVFGLKAFDEKIPITRMLPGSSPCELRLLLPDTKIGKDGFHDVVVETLSDHRHGDQDRHGDQGMSHRQI